VDFDVILIFVWRGNVVSKNVRMNEDGHIIAQVPMVNSLPEIKVSFKDGNTTFVFTGHYDGTHSVTMKLLSQMEKGKGKI